MASRRHGRPLSTAQPEDTACWCADRSRTVACYYGSDRRGNRWRVSFRNRLVGTIVSRAGGCVLPGLLSGQKKHYQDEFAAIPLVPKHGDRDEPDI